MPDIRGKHPLGSFGRISEELANGLTVAIEDNLLDPRTSDPDTVKRYAAIGLRAGIVVPILDRGNYVGGVFVQSAEPRRWTRYDIALAEAAAGKLWQALLRFRTETALRDSEERYRLIFEQANDIIFTADVDQRITACNLAGANALGLPPSEIIGRSISEFVSPEGFAQTTAMLQQKIERGGNTRHEISVIKPSGEIVRWENDSTLVLDRDGEPIGLLSISRDVTERRAFEQRRELLINELNHRVKNALALVQGIAHQTFRNGVDPEAAQRDFLLRIATLAKAHDLLTREQWEGVTLTELVRAATAAFDAARIAAGGPPLRLAPKAAVAIAMALHELSTNALKYGALSRAEGSVTLEWTVDADHFEMIWAERGGPAVQPPGSHGFGVKMLERALASDLHGTVSIAFAATGVQCAIRAPLEGNIL
jgi:PAS domain S-box-containing protein